MSISAFIIALPLVGVQAEAGIVPPAISDRPAIEQRDVTPPPAQVRSDGPPVTDTPPIQPEQPASTSQPASPEDAIIVTARPAPPPGDPMQALNVETFSAVQSVDEAVTGPVALAYKDSVPAPVRSGLRNFLGNLQEPVVFLNYLLQLKIGKGAETFGRFAVNSTIGVAGLLDVAKRPPFNLPHRTNGFAYTLGYYGVKPGAFMYLPLIGPTTVRDLGGRLIDLSVLPFAVGAPFNNPVFTVPTTTVRLIDERAEVDDDIRALRNGTRDPYTTVREDYLRVRQAEIDALHGAPK